MSPKKTVRGGLSGRRLLVVEVWHLNCLNESCACIEGAGPKCIVIQLGLGFAFLLGMK
jgi:hypothetical protein